AKIHGKAVVDGVGLRLGRSLGSLILVAIVIPIFGPIQNAKACLFGIILAMGVLWLYIVKKLDVAYRKACRDSIS
ncbi:MAG: Npt1/Npt2 family nucleotide transporter, partial [Bacteroidota bacterium]